MRHSKGGLRNDRLFRGIRPCLPDPPEADRCGQPGQPPLDHYPRLQTKISSDRRTLFLKFPLLEELGLAASKADSNLLFLRCDFAPESLGVFTTEVSQISADAYVLYAKNYDLPTLFANKIIAFLQREFFKGQEQEIAFKGRDLFDLVWFLEKSANSGFKIQPNWERLHKGLSMRSKKNIVEALEEKMRKINKSDVYKDLVPFIESEATLRSFSENFARVFEGKCKHLLTVGHFVCEPTRGKIGMTPDSSGGYPKA